LNVNKKTGGSIASELLTALERHKIPLADCKAQAYDNGANMSGKINGVQALILEKNHLTLYSPCSAHSLNLVGVNTIKINFRVKTFFGCCSKLSGSRHLLTLYHVLILMWQNRNGNQYQYLLVLICNFHGRESTFNIIEASFIVHICQNPYRPYSYPKWLPINTVSIYPCIQNSRMI
jgi:hypothetical protein